MHESPVSADVIQRRKAAFAAWMKVRDLNVNRVSIETGIPVSTLYSYMSVGPKATKALTAEYEDKIARTYELPVEAIFGPFTDGAETLVEPNHVRAWREHSSMSAEQVAQELGVTEITYRLLEGGALSLSAGWMRKLAPMFRTKPTCLGFDPNHLDRELLDAMGIPRESQAQVQRILDTFRLPDADTQS
jgi:DNA-binding XRE family transcriptional regulator